MTRYLCKTKDGLLHIVAHEHVTRWVGRACRDTPGLGGQLLRAGKRFPTCLLCIGAEQP